MSLTLYDEFAGFGGSSSGATAVPGVELVFAANHWDKAIQTHALNFPAADHFEGDVVKADIARFPRADLFWSSPACPAWSSATGEKRTFDTVNQGVMFDEDLGLVVTDHEVNRRRSRALMEEVPRYLDAMALRGQPVLAGVVENVVQVRKWAHWHAWLARIRHAGPGYRVWVIAYNSMHARPVRTNWAPQTRGRCFVAYALESLGRVPDWRKWLSPRAWCPVCGEVVEAVQAWKRPGVDMGVYGPHGQYVYRCPRTTCRHHIVEPEARPAATAIDWSLPPGQKIGERDEPLKPATRARIEAGLTKYARPLVVPAGGTWRADATPLTDVLPTRTTRENDAVVVPEPFLALLRSGRPRTIGVGDPPATAVADGSNHGLVVPPLLVPVEGREGKSVAPAGEPLRTQTGRRETALVIAPFLSTLRGGGSHESAYSVGDPLATFSAAGLHHGLTTPPGAQGIRWGDLLMSYYGNGNGALRPVGDPLATIPTRDRFALVGAADDAPQVRVEDCTFRMLTPAEIAAGMAFRRDYRVLPGISKRDQVRGLGNAVTPPVAELLVSALVETITGEPLERDLPSGGAA